eukprot:TRINITY_DN55326_c0_g1_i1.p1 TRINITY_DN55326_c0_g1~~TRINITY_DN55326_c0_g1_i1.p1  ORF type:complete len:435 (+),score=56.52 TRINITY_DN55326_c0_g1_i1:160-1305(+)
MVVSVLTFAVLAVQPFFAQLSHLRAVSAVLTLLGIVSVLVTKIARRADASNLFHSALVAEGTCLTTRILSHVACIAFDGDNTHVFLKMVSIWWMPVGSVRSCDSVKLFSIYILLNTLLTVGRFANNWEQGFPWIVSTFVVNTFLLDLASQRRDRSLWRDQLRGALEDLEVVAQETARNMIMWLCDATLIVGDDMRILEPTPGMASLLGMHDRNLQGRSFTSFLHNSDVERFQEHMQEVAQQSHWRQEERTFRAHLQVKLMDVFGQPVSVHVFHASFCAKGGRPTHVMGLTETWLTPKKKTQAKVRSSTSDSAGSGATKRPSHAPGETLSTPGAEEEIPQTPVGCLGVKTSTTAMGARERRFSPRGTATGASQPGAAKGTLM